MNLPPHIRDLIEKLEERTKTRKIQWKSSSRETEYSYFFSRGTVTVDVWKNDDTNLADIVVYNDDGIQVERYVFHSQEPEYRRLLNLHAEITKAITKADETFGSLFNDLDNI